jgi:mannosyl-3-phosphoglycerate phosphatase
MKPPIPVVVFADVSQAFFDDEGAEPRSGGADEILARESIMFVLSSSMTRAELESRQRQLGIRQPFICENGAAVLVPHGYFSFRVPFDRDLTGHHVIEFGRPYADVVTALRTTSTRVGVPVVSYSDLSVEEVANESGLSLAQARLAKLREYDEPFRLLNPTRGAHNRLWRALRAERLSCTYRAAHEHVGSPVDKGNCVGVLIGLYRRAFGTCLPVGLGSSYRTLLHRVTLVFAPHSHNGAWNGHAIRQMPRPHWTANDSRWTESIVDLARRARGRGLAHVSALD